MCVCTRVLQDNLAYGKFTQTTYKLLLYFVNKLAEILFLNLIYTHVMLIKLWTNHLATHGFLQ